MSKLKSIFNYTFLSIVSIISIFPFIWMVVSSTNKSVDVTKGRLLPGSHLVENIQSLLNTTDLVSVLSNSIKIADQFLFNTYLPRAIKNAEKRINYSGYLQEVKE